MRIDAKPFAACPLLCFAVPVQHVSAAREQQSEHSNKMAGGGSGPAVPGSKEEPQLRHRILAAAGASVVSALLVNPLDVVKVRFLCAARSCKRAGSVCGTPRCTTCLWSASHSIQCDRMCAAADAPASRLAGGPQPLLDLQPVEVRELGPTSEGFSFGGDVETCVRVCVCRTDLPHMGFY